MAEYTEFMDYITQEGDRWDSIAYEFYGDPTRYEAIIAANPFVPIIPILPSGIPLQIPVIEDTEETTINEDLPPWKL